MKPERRSVVLLRKVLPIGIDDILQYMKNYLIMLLFLSGVVHAAETTRVLTAEDWAVPRDGDALRNMPTLRVVMDEMQKSAGSRMLIQYPGGDEGTLWAHELRAWLVSLGLESARIELVPGGGHGKSLAITVLGSGSSSRATPTVLGALTHRKKATPGPVTQVAP